MQQITSPQTFSFSVDAASGGQRLDIFCALQPSFADFSRSKLKKCIDGGKILVNGTVRKPSYRMQINDQVGVELPPAEESHLLAEDIFFEILHEDDDIVVISKPPGLVVHPACGHWTGTLVHGLLYHCKNLSGINGELRPGIVHRLDKDTSGLMVVAKNDIAHHGLVAQFQAREVTKVYRAIIDGRPKRAVGRVNLPIGRHPVSRKKMAVNETRGRSAVTNWRLLEELAAGFSYLEVNLETGRTHQIRVHMAALGHPVAGDILYGKKNKYIAELDIKRQSLHAYHLAFKHPVSGAAMAFTAPLWPDMADLLTRLRSG